MNKTLSILICSHNRSELLLRTLNYINMANRPDNWTIDILVVANACTDDTLKKLRQFSQNKPSGLPLRWIEEAKPGKSNALNLGLSLIQSKLIAFVDDDHRVDKQYLTSIVKAVEDYPEADLFCGRIIPDWDGSEPSWIHDNGPYRIYPLPIPRFDQGDKPRLLPKEAATPGGGNLIIRRSLFDRVGEFSTNYGPVGHNLEGAEDIQWVSRARKLGAIIQYVPTIIQYHYVDLKRLTLPYLIKKSYKRSYAVIRASEKKPRSIPIYMYRKIAKYLLLVFFSINRKKRRFYLVRLASSMGEFRGFLYLKNYH